MGGPARLILLLAALLWATAAAALDLPALSGRVVDAANILPPEVERTLTERLAAQERASSNQIVVATVPGLQGADIETFAVELFRTWKLGQQGRDNGVLLLVAPNERRVRIEVGYGLEGRLTDVLAEDVIQTRILPRFRAGDFPGGVLAGAAAVIDIIDGAYAPLPRQGAGAQAEAGPTAALPFIVFFLIVWVLMFRRGQRRRARAMAGHPAYRRHGGLVIVPPIVLGGG
ncbi:MAG TPA: TPM domain-containing protein, partial [Alphaproteobacteria bacterium]|nr:TPM domain-containing protein [Alphaproteobacteria bacterium]